MATYVLVGGGWLGGWCWQRVARRLREEGHDAYPVTLTGLGERVHLASPEVDLETHITDVVNLVEFEDLRDVVLLGHSYGGLVVTGAADRVPERISELVYLDTMPLPDGGGLIEKFPPELRKRTEDRVRESGEGWKFPVPPPEELANMASLEGVDEDHLRLLYSRATPQPLAPTPSPCGSRTLPEKGCLSWGYCAAFRWIGSRRWSPATTPRSARWRARTGASSSCPRVTIRCSRGRMTWRRCSSTCRLARPCRTTMSAAEGDRRSSNSRNAFTRPYAERHERARRPTIKRLLAAWRKASPVAHSLSWSLLIRRL